MILVIDGARLSTRDYRKKPGIGSRLEDFDGSDFIRSTITSTLTGSKDDNRCTEVVASSASRKAGARDSWRLAILSWKCPGDTSYLLYVLWISTISIQIYPRSSISTLIHPYPSIPIHTYPYPSISIHIHSAAGNRGRWYLLMFNQIIFTCTAEISRKFSLL